MLRFVLLAAGLTLTGCTIVETTPTGTSLPATPGPAPSSAPAVVVPAPVAPAPPAAPATPVSGVTLANYNRLEKGMSYAQVVAILGEPGTELSRSFIANITTVMYQWMGQGSLGANMNAMFQDDKLISKAQLGLR